MFLLEATRHIKKDYRLFPLFSDIKFYDHGDILKKNLEKQKSSIAEQCLINNPSDSLLLLFILK
jgi:hypothetical protein